MFRLQLFSEWQALLKPFFVGGWDVLPDRAPDANKTTFAGNAAICFRRLGDIVQARKLYQISIAQEIEDDNLGSVIDSIGNLSLLTQVRNALRKKRH